MRKQTVAAVSLLLLIMLTFTACVRNDAAGTSGSGTSAAVPAKEEPATRTVMTVNGEVAIPANPQRIVATYYIGELAALGVKPIGTVTRQLGAKNPNLASFTEGMADIGAAPNLEAIAGLEPDLIIAMDLDKIDYAQYARIAPTVVIPWVADDAMAKLRSVAKLLGKEEQAEAFIKDYEAKADLARQKVKGYVAADETVSIFRFFGKSIRVYGGRDIGHALYNGLRLTPSPLIREAMQQNPNFTSTQDISLEQLPNYAADRIFVVVTDEDGDRAYKEAQQLSVWTNLPAVKNKKVYQIPADKWFTYDPVSIGVTLNEAVRILTADGSK